MMGEMFDTCVVCCVNLLTRRLSEETLATMFGACVVSYVNLVTSLRVES